VEENMAQDKLEKIKDLAKKSNQTKRMNNQLDRFNVYIDNFQDQVNTLLKAQFNPDNHNMLYYMQTSYLNLLKKIVNLKSVLYKNQANRQWLVGEEPDENYTDLIENSNIHVAYQALNKFVNVNNTAFMRVSTDEQRKRIVYDAIPSDSIIVLQNIENPLKMDALLRKTTINEEIFYIYWDTEEFMLLDESFNPAGEREENPYIDPATGEGIIPYIPFWALQPIAGDFWNETISNDLYQSTLQINVQMAHLNNQMKLAGLRQLVFSGLMNEDIKKLYEHIVDGLRPIALKGEEAKAMALEMSGHMKEFMDVVHDIISQVSDQHGISFASQTTTAQRQSAAALKIEKEALDNLREEQEPLFRDSEEKVGRVTAIMANTDLGTNINLNEGALDIEFVRDPEYIDSEIIPSIEYATKEGYKSKTQIFMELNPGTESEDEAKKQIQQNMTENRELSFSEPSTNEIDQAFAADQQETQEQE
jgi:bifunctional DNase/RNase